jgi:hypothetical protein
MSDDKVIHHGWFSIKQSKIGGTVWYKTPDGGRVECTCVTSDKSHGTKWDDIAYVGEVTEYISRASDGSLDADDLYNDKPWDANKIAKLEKLIRDNIQLNKKDGDPNRWN